MHADQPKLAPVLGIGCVLLIVILIILWPYHEVIGIILGSLIVLTILIALYLWVKKTLADIKDKHADTQGKLNEQGLRHKRLRPFDHGYYEIPLDNHRTYMPPLQQKGQGRYYQEGDPRDSSSRGWD